MNTHSMEDRAQCSVRNVLYAVNSAVFQTMSDGLPHALMKEH
ncbi:hypothetical protein W911_12790 [Hyphomicrobium nitrativorans NL23]|uniref:Uncharacterized protein n=1 Tax=Hyphomicrobium nitrativorans NL23 TaxID=1029756 RepID=V5SIE3_9HYPH|nr:hypothetical protein W911_12790 [Hyphomicrobium nitrativorans NL23]